MLTFFPIFFSALRTTPYISFTHHTYGILSYISNSSKRRILSLLFFEEKIFFANRLFKRNIITLIKHRNLSLDVGSGEGRQTSLLSAYFKDVVALDLDVRAVKRAHKSRKSDNINFLIADARFLPFVSKTFDFILCTEVIEHIKEDYLVFSDVYRVSSDKTILYFSTSFSSFFKEYSYPLSNFLRKFYSSLFITYLGPFLRENKCSEFTKAHGHVRLGYSLDDFQKFSKKYNLKIKKIFFRYKKPISAFFFELQQCFPLWITPIYVPFVYLFDYFDCLQDGDGFDVAAILEVVKS